MVAPASPWAVSLFSMLLFHIVGAQDADTEGTLSKNTAMYILIAIAALYFALTALCLLLVVCVCYCNHSFKKKSEAAPEKTEQIPLTPIKEELHDESKDPKSFGYSPLPTDPEKPEKAALTPVKETKKKMDESKDLDPFGYSPLPAPEKPEKVPLTPVKKTGKKTDESKDLNPLGDSTLPADLEKPEKAPLKETGKKTDESKYLSPFGDSTLPTTWHINPVAAPKNPEKAPLRPVKETRKKTDESKYLSPFGNSTLPTPEKPRKVPFTPVKETEKKSGESKDLAMGYPPLPAAKLPLSGLAKPHRVESQPPVGHFTTPLAHAPAAVHKMPSARKGRRHQEKRKPPARAAAWDHIGAGVMNPGYMEEFPSVTLMKNELRTVSHKWFTIGRELNIPVATLNSIKRLNTADDDLCLMNMCEQWLRIESNPSWTAIVAALESTVIDERALARTIMEKYPCNDANYSPVVAQKNLPEANILTRI